MTDTAQDHAIKVQLAALSGAQTYGALALAGLIALNIVGMFVFAFGGAPKFALGGLCAVISAFAAYYNYVLIVGGKSERSIGLAMLASIVFGIASALAFVSGLLS